MISNAVGTEAVGALLVTSFSDRPEAETIIGLHRLGFRLRVMSSPRAAHYERMKEAGVSVVPLEFRGKLDTAAIRAIRRELTSDRYDILHLFNNKAAVNGLLAARGVPIRVVVYRGIVGNESFANPFSWMRCLNPRVDRIVCVAEAVREYFLGLRLLGLRVPPEKAVTIYKGHDLAWYDQPPVARPTLGISSHAFVACCVANWRPRKGIEVLLDAFERLPDDVDAHLLLVGNMKNDALQKRLRAHRRAERIHLLGYRRDAAAVVAAADVAVLPSLRREGLPKTVIEAMAYGVAPIVTAVGGSPELVEDGVSGLVVPPGDAEALANALLRLYSDREAARALGAAARQRIASRFTIGRTIAETAQLYRELAGAHRGSPIPSQLEPDERLDDG
ncbi:MAG TPA: glycosyltransferase family 4 protein [Gammaproteobacteria bacterium]